MEKSIEQEVVHHWEPMEEFQLKEEDISEWNEGNRFDILKKLKRNQYLKYGKVNVEEINLVLDRLREGGLNIGKGKCEYGYKLPVPQDKSKDRELIIFRRY